MKSKANRPAAAGGSSNRQSGELALRIVSAIILAAVSISLTYAGLWPFVLLICTCILVLAWEWGGIAGERTLGLDMSVHAGILILAAILAGAGQLLAGLAILATGSLAVLVMLRRPVLALGILYIGLPAIALVAIRSDTESGLLAIVFIFLVVWCADTMAFVFGKSIGGAKVAPSVSPGKTWSGAVGGALCPALLGFFYAKWLGGTEPYTLALVAGGLAIVSQIGDFAESAIKRRAGIKDSSGIIPGHGGLLDRLDALIFAAVAAGILALIRGPAYPGRALLVWS